MHDAGWGWWLLMSIGMVAFWALIIVGVVWLARGRPTELRQETPRERPDEILKRRLARGEISIDEYDQLHETLGAVRREPVLAGDEVSAASVR